MKNLRPLISTMALGVALAVGLGLPGASHGQRGPIYYKIGGGRPVPPGAHLGYNYSIGVGVNAGANFSCGKFNLRNNLSNILRDVGSATDEMQNAMVAAARAAVASLPALILQRVNPGLYDIFQNALLEAKARINVAVASCQQLEATMAADPQGNPFEGWVRVGRWSSWQDKGAATPNAVTAVSEQVKTDNGRDGVPWVCTDGGEKAGGVGQRPIRPIRDGVITGINILLGRQGSGLPTDLCANAAITGATTGAQRMAELFETPAEAAEYTAQIIGDLEVTTYDGGFKGYQPGTGVLPYVEREQITIASTLNGVVNLSMGQPLSDDQIKAISAPQLEITDQTLNALRSLQGAERQGFLGRLSSEVAVARNIEKLLLVRRALLAARDVPELRNGVALKQIQEGIDEIQQQVEELMFETRIRHELVSNTALALLESEASKRSETVIITSPNTGGGIEHGAPARAGQVGDNP